MPSSTANVAKVYLVGAGPGDPRLITLRGAACLAEADVVLYDYLVNDALLCHAPTAEHICLGHHRMGRVMSQEAINERMVAEARAGRIVVRLKSGDPCVFGRSVEETSFLRTAGIPYEIVPGITAGLAVAGCADVPLTQPDVASAVALITGRERNGKHEMQLDYASLASFSGTLVFYMGVTTAAHWSRALLDHGKPAAAPVAIVRRCSWPDQQVVHCTLDRVAEVIVERHLRPPAVIVVGAAAAMSSARIMNAGRR